MTAEQQKVQRAFQDYVASAEGMAYLESEDFEQRAHRLFSRFDAGEEMTVAAAADFIGLPCDVFRFLYANYLVLQSTLMGEPETGRAH